VILFGSHARGDAEPGSDIDVLVVLRGDVSPIGEIQRTLDIVDDVSLDHDVTVACMFVSETEFSRDRTPLLINVRREGAPI
jgi:predicted nucleotidyltransferase